MIARAEGAYQPTPAQELLLKACLLEPDDAIPAWREWRASVDLDHVDAGSVRLLPMLAERLTALGVDDPAFGKYRGVQRRTWARNRLLLRRAARVLDAWREAGITGMALKGAVLAVAYYPSVSLRPMGDVDLIVRRHDLLAGLDLLEGIGFAPVPPRPRSLTELGDRYAAAFDDRSTSDVQVDVHWGLLYARYSDAADEAMWRAAEPLTIEGVAALAPSTADLLVHVCAHGARWNPVPPVRWVVDAAMLIRSGKVDWNHLRAQTERWRLSLPLARTLNYLRVTLHLDVPGEVIDALARHAPDAAERMLYEADQRTYVSRPLLTMLRIHAHIARHQPAGRRGIGGYWRYFRALRAGRSFGQTMGWLGERVLRGARP